jgi:hypothetical protein
MESLPAVMIQDSPVMMFSNRTRRRQEYSAKVAVALDREFEFGNRSSPALLKFSVPFGCAIVGLSLLNHTTSKFPPQRFNERRKRAY